MSLQSVGPLVSIILAGRLFNPIDARYLVTLGCLIAGYGTWNMASFNPQTDFWGITLPGIYRGMGSGLIFITLPTLSLSSVSREDMGSASRLFNIVRTIGARIAISV